MSEHAKLKLVALDRQGLSVVSAHVQDSCVRRADMIWLPNDKRFVLGTMRDDWAATKHGRHERVGSALRFDRVMKVSHLGLGDRDGEDRLRLVGVAFEKTDAPSGIVVLAFTDGSLIRLEVECLAAEMRDIGPRRPAETCPGHALTEATAE